VAFRDRLGLASQRRAFFYVHDGVSKPSFAARLETFAREAGARAFSSETDAGAR
jgi:hypothetical protein